MRKTLHIHQQVYISVFLTPGIVCLVWSSLHQISQPHRYHLFIISFIDKWTFHPQACFLWLSASVCWFRCRSNVLPQRKCRQLVHDYFKCFYTVGASKCLQCAASICIALLPFPLLRYSSCDSRLQDLTHLSLPNCTLNVWWRFGVRCGQKTVATEEFRFISVLHHWGLCSQRSIQIRNSQYNRLFGNVPHFPCSVAPESRNSWLSYTQTCSVCFIYGIIHKFKGRCLFYIHQS